MAARVEAHAKINLSLRLLGKRPDGYHAIDTLMARIGLHDTITLERGEDGIVLTCSDPALPTGEENLAYRAAAAFYAKIGMPPALRVHLEKRIPHGAGLGGGSSDAAAVLAGLNRLHAWILPRGPLHELAAGLGSDVPFFLEPGAARCTGRGEIIGRTPLPVRREAVLLKPPFGVATPWAYSRWAGARPLPGTLGVPDIIDGWALVNDLEASVFGKYALLADVKAWLRGQGEVEGALMSGSGATMVGILRTGASGEAVVRRARLEFGETLWAWTGELGG
jgi:4-diphosphocytidyl-2-C-methyl-D-erythritol kinase